MPLGSLFGDVQAGICNRYGAAATPTGASGYGGRRLLAVAHPECAAKKADTFNPPKWRVTATNACAQWATSKDWGAAWIMKVSPVGKDSFAAAQRHVMRVVFVFPLLSLHLPLD